ncbi:DUF2628 domain-containing protein [Kaistella jeonii]|uniref:DUF2628 domain-containing protein n=1 Tax=Kaistella jeonii TaxID=266749 RepID=A0A0C1F7C9_9FLAO|nr:DUF2628 domain-containing protein [Kaistella jeonii]KIA89087.1 hypothetical protein OA86_08460 [Kaistella jeonii]SFB94596.1 Protein of unknown function [Kaistella jeonii]VEI97103.1 Protein of uncharacterised function (DUF2628) [Kaistella jeonii]
MDKIQLYEIFFQKSNSYYHEQLKYYEQGKKWRFNYSAVIFGVFWFLYRKMYLEFFIIFIFYYLETIFENVVLTNFIGIEQTKVVNFSVTIILLMTLGIVGNNLYIKKAKRTLKNAEVKYSEIEKQKEYIAKKGGTSYIFIIFLLVILILSIFLS